MKSIQGIFFMLISIFLFSFFSLEVYAASLFSDLETKIFSESSERKIKKAQLSLREFGLYSGNIDGKYKSLEGSLIAYQKKTGIKKDFGYFGYKTLTALKEDFPDTFDKVTKKYLLMDEPATNVRYFFLTAYYSPIPGQKRYTTGSYSGDIRLNGEGKRTASGKGVFSGLLAGPRNYSFGTKIEFEGLGVGVVEDRGGAIVNSGERGHEYDRIDVWMGYGDEGLERALKWGKRKVLGKVVPETRPLSIEFGNSVVTKYKGLEVNAEKPKKENVIKLQKLLTDINIYSGDIDGNFLKIRDELISFQIKSGIINSRESEQAGYFGVKTYIALREDFGGDIIKKRKNKLDEDVLLSDKERNKLNELNKKLTGIINKKFNKNSYGNIRYRLNIRDAITIQINKDNNKKRKKYLKYLKSII